MFRDDEDNVFVSSHEQVYGRSKEETKRRALQKMAAEKRIDKVKSVNSLRRQLFQLKMDVERGDDSDQAAKPQEDQEGKKVMDAATKTRKQEEDAQVEGAQTQASASKMIEKEKQHEEAKQASQQEYSSDAA